MKAQFRLREMKRDNPGKTLGWDIPRTSMPREGKWRTRKGFHLQGSAGSRLTSPLIDITHA